MGASQGTYWLVILVSYFFVMSILNVVIGTALIGAGIANPVQGSQTPDYSGVDSREFAQTYNITQTSTLESINPIGRINGVLEIVKLLAGFYIFIVLPFPLNLAFGFFFLLLPSFLLIAAIYNLFPTVN